MDKLIGMTISQYDGNYRLVSYKPFSNNLANMKRVAEETGKYPAYFFFQKVLKSGKLSEKQGFVAFIFKGTNNVIKL